MNDPTSNTLSGTSQGQDGWQLLIWVNCSAQISLTNERIEHDFKLPSVCIEVVRFTNSLKLAQESIYVSRRRLPYPPRQRDACTISLAQLISLPRGFHSRKLIAHSVQFTFIVFGIHRYKSEF